MGLSDLPEELIANIADRLISDDLFALRSCSRALQEKTLHNFRTEYFSSKCVHFSTDSLKALLAISKTKFAESIKEISVSTGWFSEVAFTCPGRSAEHYRPTLRQSEAYKFLISDQKQIKKNGDDRALLTEALKGLSGLKTVSLVDSPSLLKAPTDYRGQHKVRRQTGTDPMDGRSPEDRVRSPEYRKHVNHVWNTIMCALADAHDNVSLESLKPMTLTTPNSIAARALKVGPKTLARLAKVLRKASYVNLQLKTTTTQEDYRDAIEKYAGLYLNATDVFLSGDLEPDSGYLCRTFMRKVNAEIITNFALNGLCIEGTALAKIVGRMRPLVDLRLDWIDLTTDSWPLVLEVIGKLEQIDHLHLMYLREAGSKAFFRTLKEDGEYLPPSFGDGWEDESEGDDESDFDTDDDLPDLEPVDGPEPTNFTGQPIEADHEDMHTSSSKGAPNAHALGSDSEDSIAEDIPDYVPEAPPGGSIEDFGGERGFYVCVSGHDRIMRHLKVFIKEYSTGESLEDAAAADLFGGMVPIPINLQGLGGGHGHNGGAQDGGGQPPAHIIHNIMQAAFGGAPPPFPGFAPPPAGGNPTLNGHHQHHHHHGPPAPPQAAAAAPPPQAAWHAPTVEDDDEDFLDDDEVEEDFDEGEDEALGGVSVE